eukprot:1682463-Rhodomonas_salina.1
MIGEMTRSSLHIASPPGGLHQQIEAERAVLGERPNHEHNLRNRQTNVLIAEQITNPGQSNPISAVTGSNQSTVPLSPDQSTPTDNGPNDSNDQDTDELPGAFDKLEEGKQEREWNRLGIQDLPKRDSSGGVMLRSGK